MIDSERRLGIVHRLDKGTSGVMVVAKSTIIHEKLSLLFAKHDIERIYECFCLNGNLSVKQTLKSLISRHPTNRIKMSTKVIRGKEAITTYRVIKSFENFSFLEVQLKTGRTHQIRVHLSELLNSPILCDTLYGNPSHYLLKFPQALKKVLESYPYPLLHAKVLGFIHPITDQNLRFEKEAPEPFKQVMSMSCQ